MHLKSQSLLRHSSVALPQLFFVCPRCTLHYLFSVDRTYVNKPSPRARRIANASSSSSIPRPSASSSASPPPNPPNKTKKPTLNNVLIVVEGMNDKHAVTRAVNADVFVLHSATKSTNSQVIAQLQDVLASRSNNDNKNIAVVILTDPDVAGRQARNALHETFKGCWHAFIPTMTATAQSAVRQKDAGDVGVEHASVEAIRWALKRARRSNPGRSEFTRELIQSLGLVSTYDASSPAGDAAKRRFLVCSFLGLGECNGKQLLRQLNDYGFTKDDLAEALKWAEEKISGFERGGGGGG